MILLEQAASRVATATAEFGLHCAPERSLRDSSRQIRLLAGNLAPISLPAELRDFWVWWAPESFQRPAFDGFLSPSEALSCREGMVDIGFPSILMPIAKYGKGMIWIELESPDHPGSRVYFGSYADPDLRLWAIGVSGLMEVLADALESGGVTAWSDGDFRLDPSALQSALNANGATPKASTVDWRIPIADPDSWPCHWKSHSQNQ